MGGPTSQTLLARRASGARGSSVGGEEAGFWVSPGAAAQPTRYTNAPWTCVKAAFHHTHTWGASTTCAAQLRHSRWAAKGGAAGAAYAPAAAPTGACPAAAPAAPAAAGPAAAWLPAAVGLGGGAGWVGAGAPFCCCSCCCCSACACCSLFLWGDSSRCLMRCCWEELAWEGVGEGCLCGHSC